MSRNSPVSTLVRTQPTMAHLTQAEPALHRRRAAADTVVALKEHPADICTNCGEYYLDDRIAVQVLARADNAVREGAEVEVVRYAI